MTSRVINVVVRSSEKGLFLFYVFLQDRAPDLPDGPAPSRTSVVGHLYLAASFSNRHFENPVNVRNLLFDMEHSAESSGYSALGNGRILRRPTARISPFLGLELRWSKLYRKPSVYHQLRRPRAGSHLKANITSNPTGRRPVSQLCNPHSGSAAAHK